MEQFEYISLGGGVSGLGLAKRLAENGKSVLVLEKEDVVGGLSRSIEYKGYYLDFCAHRFHTKNEKLLKEILALPGLRMERHIKKSRIFMFGKWLKYPFEIQSLLRAMPLSQSIPAGFSFLYNHIKNFITKPTGELRSYKDWFVRIYGKKLYDVMCYPYTSKIWHIDPGLISADWADQRFQRENVMKLVKRILKKLITLDFTNYNLEDDSLAPDGGPFYYPYKGIQELPDALARAATSGGAKIICGARVLAIDSKARIVTYKIGDSEHKAQYGELISTIPLHKLYELGDRKDTKIAETLASLKYMDIIFVYLFIDKPQISNDHWLYFPDKDIIFNRAVEFSNWSPKMCPKGKTSICFDITTFDDNREWEMTNEQLIKRTVDDAVSVGYIQREDVEDALVFRVKHAYPFYDLDYKQKLGAIADFLQDEHTHLLGRTGYFQYNNSDNSIETGFALAEKLLAEGSKH